VNQEEKYGTMNPLFLLREGSLIPQKLELSLSNGEKYQSLRFKRGINLSQYYTFSKCMAQGKYEFLQENYE
jgi:hypothetical protein